MNNTLITINIEGGKSIQATPGASIASVLKELGGVAKIAVAVERDGELLDISQKLDGSCTLKIITNKDEAALDTIRHSCAHLLAHAVKHLFPAAQVTIGPVIENGFYYDFSCDTPFSEDDLLAIEKEMKALASKQIPVVRRELSREEALALFESHGEHYKCEIINNLEDGAVLSVYEQDDFVDLCRGPHVPHTGFLKAFKLMKVAGAYWRGDSNNEMLQRIYGTAWLNPLDLQAYLKRLKEAQERDHRLLAKAEKMDLYHIEEDAPGLVFWHPNGWAIVQTMQQDMLKRLARYGYQSVNTPILGAERLWQQSGHSEKFSNNMFFTQVHDQEGEHDRFAVKPMSCPLHLQIFKQGLKSYRDLPIRLAEFGCCHRNEPSGSLHGLMRVRAFTQDDGHIFCTPDQIGDEVKAFIRQLYEVYKAYGLTDVLVKLSTRPEQRVGDDAIWDKAERSLEESIVSSGLQYEILPGEGAFYGPKIEFSLRDTLGRVWQCGTIQLDFFMPQRLEATYVDADGVKHHPVMLHRAILGTFERFMAILLEHYAGNLPVWLAPIQLVVLNITDAQADYAKKITQIIENKGIRVKLDLRNEKIGFKIRTHAIARVPFAAIVGDDEMAQGTVMLRTQSGEQVGPLALDAFVDEMLAKTKQPMETE